MAAAGLCNVTTPTQRMERGKLHHARCNSQYTVGCVSRITPKLISDGLFDQHKANDHDFVMSCVAQPSSCSLSWCLYNGKHLIVVVLSAIVCIMVST